MPKLSIAEASFSHEVRTGVSQQLGGFQDLLGVDSGLIVVHLRGDHVDHPGGAATDGAGGTVQTVHVLLLQSDDALVHILQDVILCRTNDNKAARV